MTPLILKFGGSVVTRSAADHPFDADTTARLAGELAAAQTACIVVHGTGAVGKPAAVQHGYADAAVIAAGRHLVANMIRHRLRDLNQRVVDALLTAGISAFSVEAAQLFAPDLRAPRYDGAIDLLADLVRYGCTPVLHGDHVPGADGRWHVLSSDVIVSVLARELNAQQVIFLTDVDGVYVDGPGGRHVLAELTPADEPRMADLRAGPADVSGGMPAKAVCALEIARRGCTCHIANGRTPGVLADLLTGKSRGTRIRVPRSVG